MPIRKRILMPLICAAAFAALLLSTAGSTLAYNTNSISAESGLSLEFSVKTGENSYTPIKDNSKNAIFSSDLFWEPGCMHIATLKVENTGTAGDTTNDASDPAFDFWIYPHVERTVGSAIFLTDSTEANLADVLEVYLYTGDYSGKARPSLPSKEWMNLGLLSKLPPEEKPDQPLSTLDPGKSAEFTLLFKMQESAGNEYQGKTIDAYVSLMAEMVVEP